MSILQIEALHQIIGCTHKPIDCEKCKAALAYARGYDIESIAQRIILDARRDWLEWYTLNQRKWQRLTRNPNKAVHHDSVALREKYVRCAQ
jgi:hypothetical protein